MRLLYLSRFFSIKVCAYAVMSNHTHVVLFVDKDAAKSWSAEEILTRWHTLHKGTMITQQYDEWSRSRLPIIITQCYGRNLSSATNGY